MKKTILAVVLMATAFAALHAQDENKVNAARKVWEGDYHVFQFQQFMLSYGGTEVTVVAKPDWVAAAEPAYNSIDTAIAAYLERVTG